MIAFLLCASWVLFFAFLMSDKTKFFETINRLQPVKIWLLTIGAVGLFVITNPTLTDFRYGTAPMYSVGGYNVNNTLAIKKADYLICSKYQNADGTYIGVLKNFFKINNINVYRDTAIYDTSGINK